VAIPLPSTPKSWLATIVVVLGVSIALYALFSRKSDEELIRERLDELAHQVAVDGDENILFRGNRLKKSFSKIFVPSVRVDIPELSGLASGRDELALLAARAGTYFRHAEVDISADQIDIIQGANSATVHGSATITGDRGRGTERDERRVTFGMAKVNDEWLIDSVTVASKSPNPTPLVR
jgi:hypothetical protein